MPAAAALQRSLRERASTSTTTALKASRCALAGSRSDAPCCDQPLIM